MGRPKKIELSADVDNTNLQLDQEPIMSEERVPEKRLGTPQSDTLRRVEVLTNLANALKNREILSTLSKMPDGELILNIFAASVQAKIKEIMVGSESMAVSDTIEELKNNLDVVGSLSDKLHNFFLQLHQSPLVQVLDVLNKNLVNQKAAVPQQAPANPYQYQQPQQLVQPQNHQVSPQYESQIEQTPRYTQMKKSDSTPGPAPTAPPRGGFNSW